MMLGCVERDIPAFGENNISLTHQKVILPSANLGTLFDY